MHNNYYEGISLNVSYKDLLLIVYNIQPNQHFHTDAKKDIKDLVNPMLLLL